VVNKADLPLAGRTTGQLETMLKLRRERQDVPVIETVATTGAGVAGLAAAVEARAGKTAQEKRASRTKRVQRLVAQLAGRRVCDAVLALTSAEAAAAIASAREGRISVAEAADQVLRIVLREQLSSPDVASEIGLGGRAAPRTPRSAG